MRTKSSLIPAPSWPLEPLDRRAFLRFGGAAGLLAGLDTLVPGYARFGLGDLRNPSPQILDGSLGPIDLTIAETPVRIGDRMGKATTINGTLPGPVLRFGEGDEAVIRVTNALEEDTSVHWHGILVPSGMDGVPEVSYPGIRPGEMFEYHYPIGQYGTYWYHSHSGFQEQLGHYGPLVIDPAAEEPFEYDRDYIVVLSDWTFEDPHRVMARLKKRPDYYNYQKRTVSDFFRDTADQGFFSALGDRLRWGDMRMNPTDISDVTGATYAYLMNGLDPGSNWTGLFRAGERVRLRFINAAAASYFDVRIPGLPMKVVQVSGQHVQPVETDEFRMAIAETYDVIVEPTADVAYTVFAEAMDRSGFARGTLAPREGMSGDLPVRRSRPLLTMADMGMAYGDMEGMEGMEGTNMGGADADMPGMSMASGLRAAGTIAAAREHGPDGHGPGNAAVPMNVSSRLHEPGLGLGMDGRRVLVYTDLRALEANPELKEPDREIELHLTGNMERFMWSIDGKTFSQVEPIRVRLGERIRLTMINDTMMNHPMHLHGMWMELENDRGVSIPKVHTVNVKPAEKLSVLFTAAALGPWAFHCHILYHMDAGMFRVVEVVADEVAEGQ